jgi:hypothetical protein
MKSKNMTLYEVKMLFCKFECPYRKGAVCASCREYIDVCKLCQIDQFIRAAKDRGIKMEDI